MIRCLFATDSRGHRFNRYPKPAEFLFNVDFVSIRGAKICNLVGPVVYRVKRYDKSDQVVVRLAAGINDLTTFVYDSAHEKRVLKPC